MTAVFSWKAPTRTIAWNHASMWGSAVLWARKWFDQVVFYGDANAQRLLVDGLGLPFERVHDLPAIPDELDHIRDLVKLHAIREAVIEYGPAWHLDHDAHWSKRPPQRLLDAPFVCEFIYREANLKSLFKQVRQFNSSLAKPFPDATIGLASGCMGGNDTDGIVRVCDASLALATDPSNRSAFAAREAGAGYWKSVLIGEMAYGTHWPDATGILAEGGGTEDDRRRSGWHHVAGGKGNFGLLAVMDNLFRDDFPNERAALFRRWRNLY